MDFENLKGIYGRLMGLVESLPKSVGHMDAIIGDDYNGIVDELSKAANTNLDSFKIPLNQYSTFNNRPVVRIQATTRITQLIGYLKYTYNLDEKILEIGSLINAIENKELKERCLDLLSARGKFDRPINQATLVLEDTIRQKSSVSDKEGTKLVNEVFKEDPSQSILVIDGEPEEHQGFGHICRGVMLSFRNLTHHKLIDKFTREDALKFCGFIDVLLKLLDSAKKS